jgi:hypothetical protein
MEDGEYNYVAALIRNAHTDCNRALAHAMEHGCYDVVIQSNTNLKPWESETVRGYATRYNYITLVMTPRYGLCRTVDLPEEMRGALVSVHNVSAEKIADMEKKITSFPLVYLGFFTYGKMLYDQLMMLEGIPDPELETGSFSSFELNMEEEEEGEEPMEQEGLPDDDDDDDDDDDEDDNNGINEGEAKSPHSCGHLHEDRGCLSPTKDRAARKKRENKSSIAPLLAQWERAVKRTQRGDSSKHEEEEEEKKGGKEEDDDGRGGGGEHVVEHLTVLDMDERTFHVTTDFVARKVNKSNLSVFTAVANDCGNLHITLKVAALFYDSVRGVGALVYSEDSPLDIDNDQLGEKTDAERFVIPTYFNPKDVGFSEGQARWSIPHFRRITGEDMDTPPHMTLLATGQARDVGVSARELLAVSGQAPNVKTFRQHLMDNFPEDVLRSEQVCAGVTKVHVDEGYTQTPGVSYEVLLFDEPLELPATFAGYYGPSVEDFHKYAHNTWSFEEFRKKVSKMWRQYRPLEGEKRRLPPKKRVLRYENEMIEQLLAHPNVKDVVVPVPSGILPFEAELHDISISKARAISDDIIYENEEMLRKCLPRGLSLLERKVEEGEEKKEREDGDDAIDFSPSIQRVLNGYGKFTGYEDSDASESKQADSNNNDNEDAAAQPEEKNDDDEDNTMINPLEASKINKYFTKDITQTVHIMATEKANGEAAHVAAFKIGEESFVILGSKTVHMILRVEHMEEDLEKYRTHHQTHKRFDYAITVAEAFLEALQKVSDKGKIWFFNYLVESRFTAVWELENPESCHIVPILARRLKFIGFAQYAPVSSKGSWIALKPEQAFNWMSAAGFDTVWWFKQQSPSPVEGVEDVEALLAVLEEEIMTENRFLTEGCVLNFIDKTGSVIGLVKAKNARYITSRAIRQRIFHFMRQIKPQALFPVKKFVSRFAQMMGNPSSPIQTGENLKRELLMNLHRDIVKAVENARANITRRLVELTETYVRLAPSSRDAWTNAACLMAQSIGNTYDEIIQRVCDDDSMQADFNRIVPEVRDALAALEAKKSSSRKGNKGGKGKKGGKGNDQVPYELRPFEDVLQEVYDAFAREVQREGMLESSISAEWPFRWEQNLIDNSIEKPSIEMA